MASGEVIRDSSIRGQGFTEASSRVMNMVNTVGTALLHSKYPDEFEYYLCVFEILNANDLTETLEHIAFPIMPDSIRISDNKIQTTQKTANGIVVLENQSFTPKTISISGNFGRKFKPVDISSKNKDGSNKKELINGIISGFKSGYGAAKALERIIQKSSTTEDGIPVVCMFYCYAFNANYLVQINNINFEMTKSQNRIWNYSINMTTLAPAEAVLTSQGLKETLNKYIKGDVIRAGVNQVIGFASNQSKILSNQLMMKVNNNLGLPK